MNDWQSSDGETPIDISGLKAKRVTNRRELSIAEAENVAEAVYKYLGGSLSGRVAPFTDTWSLRLHKEMFGRVWNWAGEPRRKDLNLGVPAYQISQELFSLFEDLAVWDTAWPDRIEQAAHLHYRAVRIHPFQNGNGRWSRMLANIWLRLKKHAIINWPGDIGETSPIRAEYLERLKAADAGDFDPFLELHRRYVK